MGTLDDVVDAARRFSVTHPYQPLFGRTLEMVARSTEYGGARDLHVRFIESGFGLRIDIDNARYGKAFSRRRPMRGCSVPDEIADAA
jgi:hypothetical protein